MATFANVCQDTPEKNVRFVHSIVPVVHVVEENVWKKKRLSNVNVLRDLAANLVNKVCFCNIHDTNSQSVNSLPCSSKMPIIAARTVTKFERNRG